MLLSQNLHIAMGILVIGSQRVNNSLKISDVTKEHILQLNLSQIYGKKESNGAVLISAVFGTR